MKISSIKWNRDRIDHIAKHNILQHEVEEAAFEDPYRTIKRIKTSNGFPGEYVYRLLGRTSAGKFLTFFFIPIEPGIVYPVTAREMNNVERRAYNAHRR